MEQFTHMKVALVAAIVTLAASFAGAQAAPPAPDRTGQAYEQFLLGRRLESSDKGDLAIAAYKRAMQLDPTAAEVPAELAALYLRQNRAQDALSAAEQALKIDATNREAHRVAGFVYAAMADPERGGSPRESAESDAAGENLTKAITHFEAAVERPAVEADPNVRAT